jgi:hypothetical protein
MFERFNWTRLGGSVFRYDGIDTEFGKEEDWLNDVVPALMFFRSYVLKHKVEVRSFTLDSMSVARVDHTDSDKLYGWMPQEGKDLILSTPTNPQSAEKKLRSFVRSAVDAA